MVKRARGIAFNIVLTGGIIAGLAILADRFNLGTRISEAARATGQTGGEAISKPIAGLVGGLASGLVDIRAQVDKLINQGGEAGADFQEFISGNRNLFGDLGAQLQGIPVGEEKTQEPSIPEIPSFLEARSGFKKESIPDRIQSIIERGNFRDPETQRRRITSAIAEGIFAKSEIEKAKRGEESEFVIINGQPFSTRFISEEEIRRQLERQ